MVETHTILYLQGSGKAKNIFARTVIQQRPCSGKL